MRRIVSLWLPFLPVECLRRRHGLPADRPLVTRWHDGGRQVVAAADALARTHGIAPGQPLAQAQALVPGLAVMPAAPARDAADLAALARWCLWMAPLTAPDGADGIWIDATGCAALHGGEAAMLDRLLAGLERRGLSGRAAIADTPGAAHALARHGPDRRIVLPSGAQATALDSLPVEALRLEPATADRLHRLGLGRIGALRATPRAPLARRFGALPLTRLDQALGRVAEPVRPVPAQDAPQVRRGFADPVSTLPAFRVVVDALLADLCVLMRERGVGARRLDLLFERVDGGVAALRIGTARPTRDPAQLGRLLADRLEEIDPGFGVEAMSLLVSAAERIVPDQAPAPWVGDGAGDGAGDDARADPARDAALSALADRLANRLGAGRVFRLPPAASHMPERGQRRVPADGQAGPAASWQAPWPRPIRLLPVPEPVRAIVLWPDHPPRAFVWRGLRHDIVHADGPEQVRGEWWQPTPDDPRRAYWIVEDAGGARFWLFQADGRVGWFVHGLF